LRSAEGWVESGELSPEAWTLIEPVLSPIAEPGRGNQDDDDEDDQD
jgi:hypothetical protein